MLPLCFSIRASPRLAAGLFSCIFMAFLKYVLMVIKEDGNEQFIIERSDKYGGNLNYVDYESVEKDFVSKKLHPLDLKNAVAREISSLLGKIDVKKLNELGKKAY